LHSLVNSIAKGICITGTPTLVIGYCLTDQRIPLVRGSHPRGLSPSSAALVGAGGTRERLARFARSAWAEQLTLNGELIGSPMYFFATYAVPVRSR
jgi:hypothetical protein